MSSDPVSIHPQNFRLDRVRMAPMDPPITKASLSQIDVEAIVNNLEFRHDLSLDPEVPLVSRYCKHRGPSEKAMSRAYWQAFTQELAFYTKHSPQLSSLMPSITPPPLGSGFILPRMQGRVARMLFMLRDILLSLVPETECDMIHTIFDVDFLMQQLEAKVCDIQGLVDWTANLLRSCFSPCQDYRISEMVNLIRRALLKDDVQGLVDGIKHLFFILRLIKLDLTNSYVRQLKSLIIDDTVYFEQQWFLEGIRDGVSVADAWEWYHSAFQNSPRESVIGDSHLMVFLAAAVKLVVRNEAVFPSTFELDIGRLRSLQEKCQDLLLQDVCLEACQRLLRYLGFTSTLQNDVYKDLRCCVMSLHTADEWPALSEIALEIVRAAYKVLKFVLLPSQEHLTMITIFLYNTLAIKTDLDCNLRHALFRDLLSFVCDEVRSTSRLTILQMHNRYQSKTTLPEIRSGEHTLNQRRHGIFEVGQHLAHILSLHWNIWAPIFYLQALDNSRLPDIVSTGKPTLERRKSV
ncbi:hypothetical protein MMC13_003250 [Lambiella insularis]|nr:hypothetical protein [Lambiella insularis]